MDLSVIVSIAVGLLTIITTLYKLLAKQLKESNQLRRKMLDTIEVVQHYEDAKEERATFVKNTNEMHVKFEEHLIQATKNNQTMLLMEKALLAMLRNTITFVAQNCIERGSITYNELENLEALYLAYKGLGGNSYVGSLINTTRELNKVKTR